MCITSRKHAYKILTPLNTPLLYSTLLFLFLLKNIDCVYSLKLPRQGGSNEYPQSMFWAEMWKISEFFIWKISHFLVVKFSVCLNRHVFVMTGNNMDLFKFKDQYGKELSCPNILGKYGKSWCLLLLKK